MTAAGGQAVEQVAPAASTLLGERAFTPADQEAFAALSGDRNPIHMDPAAARRSLVGDVVVHGIHTLLWSLDCLAGSAFRPEAILSIDVRFPKALYVGEQCRCVIDKVAAGSLVLRVTVREKVVASIKLATGPAPETPPLQIVDAEPVTVAVDEAPEDLTLETMANHQGTVFAAVPVAAWAAHFPGAARLIGEWRLAGLGACSRLVGMACPGLRSVFSRLQVMLDRQQDRAALDYRVTEVDDRFAIVRMDVSGMGLAGKIEAFSPPPPVRQPSLSELAGMVEPGEFAGQRALIVGGSRGIGELTAKLIAVGGGEVLITYASGKADAERVAGEIGGSAGTWRYDANLSPAEQGFDAVEMVPTHLYYFATNPIFKPKLAGFDADLLAAFTRFYCTALVELCEALWARGVRQLTIFYPSSVAVTERPRELTEYAMAKAAGEVLCADLPRHFAGFKVHVERLPRLATDQTLSVMPQSLPELATTLLPMLRAVR